MFVINFFVKRSPDFCFGAKSLVHLPVLECVYDIYR